MKQLTACICAAMLLAGCGTASVESSSSFTAGINVNGNSESYAVKSGASFGKNAFSQEEEEENDVDPSDFFEFGDFIADGIPEDAEYPALKYAVGPWKYYISEEDPETGGTVYNEWGFGDLSLDYDKNQVIIELHPSYEGDGYQSWPKKDPGYLPFIGGFEDNGALKLAGNSTVFYINEYFAWSGREYIMGEAWYSEEESGLFLMTRGQN